MPELSTALRASDADRDGAAERLRAAYAEGRLDELELHDRLGTALAARTVAELAPLVADLPQPGPGAAARSRTPRAPDSGRIGPLRAAWAAWVTVVLINVVIWALVALGSGEWIYFWPAWVAGPWGAVLLSRTLVGAGAGPCGRARPQPARRTSMS